MERMILLIALFVVNLTYGQEPQFKISFKLYDNDKLINKDNPHYQILITKCDSLWISTDSLTVYCKDHLIINQGEDQSVESEFGKFYLNIDDYNYYPSITIKITKTEPGKEQVMEIRFRAELKKMMLRIDIPKISFKPGKFNLPFTDFNNSAGHSLNNWTYKHQTFPNIEREDTLLKKHELKPGTYKAEIKDCPKLVIKKNGTFYFTKTTDFKRQKGTWEIEADTLYIFYEYEIYKENKGEMYADYAHPAYQVIKEQKRLLIENGTLTVIQEGFGKKNRLRQFRYFECCKFNLDVKKR